MIQGSVNQILSSLGGAAKSLVGGMEEDPTPKPETSKPNTPSPAPKIEPIKDEPIKDPLEEKVQSAQDMILNKAMDRVMNRQIDEMAMNRVKEKAKYEQQRATRFVNASDVVRNKNKNLQAYIQRRYEQRGGK